MKNLWKRFADLTGRSLRTVGTCVSAAAETALIQYPNGSVVRVKGSGATTGKRYFVANKRLDGEAPNLPNIVVEI